VFGYANRESDAWLKAVMAPMETQVREHQMQLRRRLESIRRIHRATDTIEDRIQELEQVENVLVQQLEHVHATTEDIERVLDLEDSRYAAAA
jgi:Fic family protein